MKIISLINRKGGVGKSAMAIALSVEAESRGIDTLVIDTDEQASVYKWSKRRSDPSPLVVSSQAVQVPDYLDKARSSGAGLVIIDTAGLATQASVEFARLSDLVVIPTGPSLRDIEALSVALDIAEMAKTPHLVVLNKLRPNSLRKFVEIRSELESVFNASVFPTYISLRQAQEDADYEGLAPQEFEPKTANEIKVLYNGIDSLLSSYIDSNISTNQIESLEI